MYQFTAHCCGGKLSQCVSLIALGCADCDRFDLVDGHCVCAAQAFDYDLTADALIDCLFDFFEYLACQDYYRSRAISDLCIL